MGPYPRSNKGNSYLLIVTDQFSRWVVALPLPSQETAPITRKIKTEIFARWGYPKGVETWTTPPDHPQANPTERRNQEMKKCLCISVGNNHRYWDKHIPTILFALRHRTNEAVDTSPSVLLLGQTLRQPGD
ncbi:hypothetical protein PR048_009099 [Dryococelus australis]|uniref:Integrase catalytic domain-containing protein n=1 Tax=Dryococelus australis TaxID=614101 RepID=A0ABQ9HZV5_9NEOP|nr:hypothetical protein PR048_009099 [Dryococelus australis]